MSDKSMPALGGKSFVNNGTDIFELCVVSCSD